MIKSLRRKVFWSILLSAAGVLLVILLAFNILNLAQTAAKVDSILDSASDLVQPGETGMHGHGGHKGEKNKSELLRSVSEDELGILMLDDTGSVISRSGCAEEMEEEAVASIALAALADADGRGSVDGWEYSLVDNEGRSGILILNASSLRGENVQTALLSLAAFAGACCLFAAVAWFLARAIVKPVEENMQAQKRFFADASHELKTPLTVIDANTAVLEQSLGPNKWLGYIKEQTVRMTGLVNELLQLSNLEEARQAGATEKREPYDAAEAILKAVLPFESVAFERGLTLETDLPEKLDAVGSAKDLEQLTAILADNAVKHSASGGVIWVSAEMTALRSGLREEPAICLSVSNTGEIPTEALEHVFDRFYQADPSRAHKDNSYGLGLAIAKGIAEKNKGSISAASENGVTVFTVLLPA